MSALFVSNESKHNQRKNTHYPLVLQSEGSFYFGGYVMKMMNEIMEKWSQFVISEKEMPVNCVTREIDTEKYFDSVGSGDNKKEVPKYKRTIEKQCDLVFIPPKKVKEETQPLPKRELEKRKKIRIRIARQKEAARGSERRKQSWLSGVLEEDEIDEGKPGCVEPSNKFHDEDGKFSSKEDATSWSLQWSKPKAGTKCGVAQVVGGSERFVPPCGRKNRDGGKAKVKCKNKEPAY